MMKNTTYFKQADLLLNVIPFLQNENNFALKGGTAINFLIRDLPRLSVDIDLTYLEINDRENALIDISDFLFRISNSLKISFPSIEIEFKKSNNLNIKLFIRLQGVTIKIEPNTILRGSVFPTEIYSLCERGKNNFEKDVSVQTLSVADLYGSKICAALDRQHPRDLFDVKLLFKNEGFTKDIRKAFIIYLISHPRPINEILNPNFQDIRTVYENEFVGMTDEKISYDQLISIREKLVKTIHNDLTDNEKLFLLSFKNRTPNWELLDIYQKSDPIFNIERIKSLPAIKWKMFNLNKMNKKKHLTSYSKLEQLLRT